MKFYVEKTQVYELDTTQQKIIQDNVKPDLFVGDMERRVAWVISQKLDQSFDSLFTHWLPILQQRYESLPSNKNAFAELVFAQPDYKPQYPVEVVNEQ
jgi:hypothetical protein